MVIWRKKMKWWDSVLLMCLAILLIGFPGKVGGETSTPKTIKVGVMGPMRFTGGEQIWWPAAIAAEEINNADGVTIGGARHEIELVKVDTNELRSIPDATAAAEKAIVIDKVQFLIGGMRSEAVMAIMDVVADNRILYLGGSGTPAATARVAENYDRYKYYFRVMFMNAFHFTKAMFALTGVVGNAVKSELGFDKPPRMAIVVDKCLVGDVVVGAVKKLAPLMGVEVAGVWRPSTFTNDYTAELKAVVDADAPIIFYFSGGGPSGTIFAKQWGELKIPAALTGHCGEADSKRQWKNTGGMCEYQTTTNLLGRVKMTPKTIPFYDKYVKTVGDYPSYLSGTYDAVYILKGAIERAGTLETERVLAEVEKTDYIGISGRLVLNPRGHTHPHDLVGFSPEFQSWVGLQWQNGELATVWPDGRAALGDEKWAGVRYKGSVDYVIPPWVIKYWKEKKK